MSDAETAQPVAKSPAKTKSAKKKKNKKGPTSHPKYNKMIAETIAALKERGGSSRQAILKYIMLNYDVGKDDKIVNNHLKMSLRAGIKNGKLNQSKGTGASGSFKLGEKAKVKKKASTQAAEKSTPKPAAKATKAKKVKKPAGVKTKKDAKPKSPKKSKSPKKVKKSPKKTAAKAKKAKAKKPEVVIEVKEEVKEEPE